MYLGGCNVITIHAFSQHEQIVSLWTLGTNSWGTILSQHYGAVQEDQRQQLYKTATTV